MAGTAAVNRCYVIADIGACHDGVVPRMFEAIAVAKQCGADMIKFQWTSDPDKMAARRKATEDGYADVYRKYLTWAPGLHAVLADECQKVGIDYGCTVFLPEDVGMVEKHVARFKVASFEAGDVGVLWACAEACERVKGVRDIIVSHGLGSTPDKMSDLMQYSQLHMFRHLRCVSAYPAPLESLNLRLLRDEKHGYDGLSDHSAPAATMTGALAVAAGATIVEAHLKLWQTSVTNPDAPHAMHDGQFAGYVQNIRLAEECLGSGTVGMHESETAMLNYRVQAG